MRHHVAQHSMAPGAGWFVGFSWPPVLFFTHQSSSRTPPRVISTKGLQEGAVSVCCPHPSEKEGRKSRRRAENNSAAAVAHPSSQSIHTQGDKLRQMITHWLVVIHQHSTLKMILTKLHRHLATSAEEPPPNTYTEPKHIA